MKKLEYIWLDGFQPEPSLRSKVKVAEGAPPDWSFDGSSTQQAEGGSSDCIINQFLSMWAHGHQTLW